MEKKTKTQKEQIQELTERVERLEELLAATRKKVNTRVTRYIDNIKK